MNLLKALPQIEPEWFGHYPLHPVSNGFYWNLPRGKVGAVLNLVNTNYWDGAWKPMDDLALPDHSAGFGYPFAPGTKIRGDGTITDGGPTYKLLSMGVMRRGLYEPIWKPGLLKVEEGSKVRQALGPYDVLTNFENCSRKQGILLPEMPAVHGDELALEYAVDGMLPPELCPCKPVAVASGGLEVPMRKWRIPGGRMEAIGLDVLEKMRFPVNLDPSTDVGVGGYWIRGQRCSYAAARNTSTAAASSSCQFLGQLTSGVTEYAVNRFGGKINCNLLPAGSLSAAWVRDSCCLNDISFPATGSDTIRFVQADWRVYDGVGVPPPDYEPIYDLIRTATYGASLWTIDELIALGCDGSPHCTAMLCDWKPLDPADVTFLDDDFKNQVSPDRYLYCGFASQDDHDAVEPAMGDINSVMHNFNSSSCGILIRLEYGAAGGGYVWLVS